MGRKAQWKINGDRLRALRIERGWTMIDAAQSSGLGERSIWSLETGESPGSLESLRTLAKLYEVESESLVIYANHAPNLALVAASAPADPPPPEESIAAAIPVPPAKPPRLTRLDALAARERALGIHDPPPVAVGRRKIQRLNATRMANAFAAHALYDKQLFFVDGTLVQQRALEDVEARAMRTKTGLGVRFEVMIEVLPGEMLSVTVHVVDEALTLALQAEMERRVRLIVRLSVVGKDDARVVTVFISDTKRAWGFVGVEIARG